MEDELDSLEVHPSGDLEWLGAEPSGESHLETYGGRVHVEWDPSAKVTVFGPLSDFIQFLKISVLWDEWVELCPLRLASNNAPSKQKILGTVLLSILAGHKRYAHITTVRSDKVLSELLGIEGLASEDSVRRVFTHASDGELTLWLHEHAVRTAAERVVGARRGCDGQEVVRHAGRGARRLYR